MKRLILAALLALTACSPTLPRCEEDQTIIGVGAFQDGRWSSYECGPAVDDYDAGARAGAVFGRATAELIERIER